MAQGGFNWDATWLEQSGTPDTPGTGKQKIYPSTSGDWYVVDDTGTTKQIAFTGGSSGTDVTLTPGADARNVVQPTGDFIALVVKNNASQAKAPFQTQSSAGAVLTSIDKDGNIYSAGALGLGGTVVDPSNTINLSKDYGNIAATTRGAVVNALTTLTGNNANVIGGAFFIGRVDQATFNFTSTSGVRGLSARGDAIGASGTATGVIGLLSSILNSGAGTITNGYGHQITSALNTGGGTITNNVGLAINTQTVGGTSNTLLLMNTLTPAAGNWGIYNTSSNDNSILGGVSIGKNTAPATKLDVLLSDSGTNAVVNVATVGHNGGSVATNFGTGILINGESSTTNDQNMARLRTFWTVATHASRTARGVLSAYDTAERDCIMWEASGTVAMVGFFGTAPVVKPTALTTALTTVTFAAPGTPDYAFATVQLAGYGFSTADEGNTALSVIANLQARVNGLETKLQALGLLT